MWAFLSDIDETLVESNWLHAAAWRDAFAVIDIPSTSKASANRSAKAATSSSRSKPSVTNSAAPRTNLKDGM
jgi:beta-phosphoglucomutase-like phosphatase (HAD superfamily)